MNSDDASLPKYCCATLRITESIRTSAVSVGTTMRCVQDWTNIPATVTAPTLGVSTLWQGVRLLKIRTATSPVANYDTDLTITGSCATTAYPTTGAFFLKATVAAAFAILAAFF